MFKVTKERRFTHEVEVQVPVDGGFEAQKLKVTFKVIDLDEMGDMYTLGGQKEFLKRAVVGLDDMVDENDKPVAYSDDLRDQLIGVPYFRAALFSAYQSAITKARAGN